MSEQEPQKYALHESGLLLSGDTIQKVDGYGNSLEKLELRDIQEIVLSQKRAYGYIVFSVVMIYAGIFLGAFLFNREIGLLIAVLASILGLVLVWESREMYHYFFSFFSRDAQFVYPLNDSKESISAFLERLKQIAQKSGYALKISNLTEKQEGEENEFENDDIF